VIVDHHYSALVHDFLRTFEYLTALFIIANSFMACCQNVRVKSDLALQRQLVLYNHLIKTIATNRLIVLKNLVVFANKATFSFLNVLH
jgi:hypothetical protein